MVITRHHHEDPDEPPEERKPLLPWLTWGHLAVTLSIVAFLWQFLWNGHKEDEMQRLEIETKMTTLTRQVEALHDVNVEQHNSESKQLADINRRLDVQRDDIRGLQQQMASHIDRSGGAR